MIKLRPFFSLVQPPTFALFACTAKAIANSLHLKILTRFYTRTCDPSPHSCFEFTSLTLLLNPLKILFRFHSPQSGLRRAQNLSHIDQVMSQALQIILKLYQFMSEDPFLCLFVMKVFMSLTRESVKVLSSISQS